MKLSKDQIKLYGILAVSFTINFPLTVRYISAPYCQRSADKFYATDLKNYQSMGEGMNYWMSKNMGRENFSTGSDRFDGDWLFGTSIITP